MQYLNVLFDYSNPTINKQNMNWRTDLHLTEFPTQVVEVSCYLLKNYLSCEQPEIVTNSYFEKRKDYPVQHNIDYIGHLTPWPLACEIYFTQVVKGQVGLTGKWQTENGLSRPPEEAIEYIKKNLWHRSKK